MRAAALSALVYITVVVQAANAAGPLFPTPLHITRQLHDPISGTTTVLNEYGYGNRLISVRGSVTSIADYEKGVLTEIDREAGTYSVTTFDALAKATQKFGPAATSSAQKPLRPLRTVGAKLTKGGRTADFFEGDIDAGADKQTLEIGVDRTVPVSKDALEVLLGSAYPGVRLRQHEAVLSAASQRTASSQPTAAYALPIEQIFRYEIDGQRLEYRNSVIRVSSDPPPADVASIPAGARLVVSRIVAVSRELDLIDHPPPLLPRSP